MHARDELTLPAHAEHGFNTDVEVGVSFPLQEAIAKMADISIYVHRATIVATTL